MDFNGQEIVGFGPLIYEVYRGHASASDLRGQYGDRVGLGVLDVWMWAREPKDDDGKRGGIKESTRCWVEGYERYERVAELAAQLPNTCLVCVADHGADIKADAPGRRAWHAVGLANSFGTQTLSRRWRRTLEQGTQNEDCGRGSVHDGAPRVG